MAVSLFFHIFNLDLIESKNLASILDKTFARFKQN